MRIGSGNQYTVRIMTPLATRKSSTHRNTSESHMNVRVRGKELHTRGHQRFMGTGAAKENPATKASIQTSLNAVKGTEEVGHAMQKKSPKTS